MQNVNDNNADSKIHFMSKKRNIYSRGYQVFHFENIDKSQASNTTPYSSLKIVRLDQKYGIV